MTYKHNHCKNKTIIELVWDTEEEAQKIADKIVIPCYRMKPYPCKECGRWHLMKVKAEHDKNSQVLSGRSRRYKKQQWDVLFSRDKITETTSI